MTQRPWLTFRQKLFVTYVLVFLVFLTLLFPFASGSVRTIVRKTFKQRLLTLISQVSSSPDMPTLIGRIQEQAPFLFLRVTLLGPTGTVLYDSHMPELLENPALENEMHQPELVEAMEGGTGYSEGFSEVMGQKLIYVARSFDFHGQRLVLRTAFPYKQVDHLISDFEIGFLILGSAVLLLFAILSWIIINHLSRPIGQIIRAIEPYQQGTVDFIPRIELEVHEDEFTQLAGTLNSLTDRIQHQIDHLREERNSKELILESLGEGIIAFGPTTEVVFINDMACQLLKLQRAQTVGAKLTILEINALVNACLIDKAQKNANLSLKSGKRLIELLAVPMPQDGGAVLVMMDKTIQHQVLEMGKEFVSNASHELRTPITIIRGFAETLHDHPELPRPMADDILAKILRNCQRMETLVKNLLTLADIEKLPLNELHDCDLVWLAENCKQMVLAIYGDALITIHPTAKEIHALAEPDLLELAVMNLISNAAKYSRPPAQIDIRIWEKPGQVFLSVSDRGLGIPPEDVDHIFERFYTVDKAHSRKLGGAGLGLAITKTIIDKHDGRIQVSSILGAGTTFTITLPKRID